MSIARVTRITTPHGTFLTPSFVLVATNGIPKGCTIRDVREEKQDLIFSNSYHLLLQPGPEVIKDAGGIHKYMGLRDEDGSMGPIITDSGGFQVFSLRVGGVKEDLMVEGKREGSFNDVVTGREEEGTGGGQRREGGELKRAAKGNRSRRDRKSSVKVTEKGVMFTSYRDGRPVELTPESTVDAQKGYGGDIIIPLDELPSYDTGRKELEESLERTHRWEARSLNRHLENIEGSAGGQAMYGIVHGGVEEDLRRKSLEYITSLPFDGFAVGGSLGGNRVEMIEMLEKVMGGFKDIEKGFGRSKPVHLLGIADVDSILGTVSMGIDTYDSCFPTRLARHGTLLTKSGKVHIKSGKHSRSYGVPVEEGCECLTCRTTDRAYLNHLFRAKEPAFMGMAVRHNVRFMNDFMEDIRNKIMNDEI